MENELWSAMKAHSQEKRANNRQASQLLLVEAGINFKSNNGGAHLVIVDHGATYDFWPGTGKWCKRGGNYFRGVHSLMREIRKACTSTQGE